MSLCGRADCYMPDNVPHLHLSGTSYNPITEVDLLAAHNEMVQLRSDLAAARAERDAALARVESMSAALRTADAAMAWPYTAADILGARARVRAALQSTEEGK